MVVHAPGYIQRIERRHLTVMGSGLAFGALAGFLLGALGIVFLPLGLSGVGVVVVGAVGGAIAQTFIGATLIVLDAVLLTVYAVVGLTPAVSIAVDRWVRHDRLPANVVDAVVIPAGRDEGTDTDRLLSGIALFRRGVGHRLVTTRIESSGRGTRASSDAYQRFLIKLAGAESLWSVAGTVRSTRDEAVIVGKALLPGRQTIILVTSPLHTRRACGAFESVGFRVYCSPAREYGNVTWPADTPADRLVAFRQYMYERAAMAKYRWKSWVR